MPMVSESYVSKARVLCVGEALVDRVATKDSTTDVVGGSLLNVACGLARLDHLTFLAGWWGQYDYGNAIGEHLSSRGVHAVSGSDQAQSSTVAYADVDESGHATYTFDLHWQVPSGFETDGFSHLHTGSIAAVLDSPDFQISEAAHAESSPLASAENTPEPSPEKESEKDLGKDQKHGPIWRAASQMLTHGTVSFDPNVRPAIMESPAKAGPVIESYLQVADLVKASDEDLAWLYPQADPLEIARAWLELGPSLVVVTRGADGAVAFLASHPDPITVPAGETKVVDTVGAGDSFMAGLISGLLDAGLLGSTQAAEKLAKASPEDIYPALERAAQASAVTVSQAGAYSPTRPEL